MSPEELIAKFSRVPCAETPSSLDPRRVVVVPPSGKLADGYSLARKWLATDGNGGVRVVGTGATLRHAWPSWLADRPGIILTDLGVYRARSSLVATANLARSIKSWLDDGLANATTSDEPSRIFYGSACLRLFQLLLESHAYAEGLGRGLAGCLVHPTHTWAPLESLGPSLRASGGGLLPAGPAGSEPVRDRYAPWPLGLLGWAAAAGGASILEQVRGLLLTADSRRRLRTLRARSAGNAEVWAVLMPTWWRLNSHLVRALEDTPKTESETPSGPFGVLLFGDLRRGERDERDLKRLRGQTLWQGLGDLREDLDRRHVDQVSSAEGIGELLEVVARGSVRMTRTVLRLAIKGRFVNVGPYRVDLARSAKGLAKLSTVDVLSATMAEVSARRVTKTEHMAGAQVIFAASSLASAAAADAVLRSAGATTFEFAHGTLTEDTPGGSESPCSARIVWTHADAATMAPFGQRCIVAGMPRPPERARPQRTRFRNVLLMSNYLHRDYIIYGAFPFEAMQEELLSVGTLLHARDPSLEVRWRPHPADCPNAVRDSAARHPSLSVSPGASLSDDLGWCDVAVSSPSAVVFEALFAGVPVFLQARPDIWETPVTAFLEPSRVFFEASDAVEPIARCLAAMCAGDADLLKPESMARKRLFGADGDPKDLRQALREERERAVQGPIIR